jgi:histidinol-phosphate phosphatase family protein
MVDGFASPGAGLTLFRQGWRSLAPGIPSDAQMSLLSWQVARLARQGCKDIVMVCGHTLGADALMECLGDGQAMGACLSYCNKEYFPEALVDASGFPGAQPSAPHCLCIDGTLFFDADIRLLYAFYEGRANAGGLCLALKYCEEISCGARVSLSENYLTGEVQEGAAGMEPCEGYVFGGLCLASREVLQAFHSCRQSVNLYGLPLAGRFFDLAVPEGTGAFARYLAEYSAHDPPPEGRPALFLDRDGVLVEDSGYIRDLDTLVYKEDVLRGLAGFACIQKQDVLLIIVSNQAGIAKGLMTRAEAEAVNGQIVRRMREYGLEVAGVWYCPYHEQGIVPGYTRVSLQRKPQPGMILLAAEALNVDISRSLMVGDKESDRIALPYLETYLLEGRYLHDGGKGGSVAGLLKRVENMDVFAPSGHGCP